MIQKIMSPKLLLGSLAAASIAFILGMLSTPRCQFASVSFSLAFNPSEETSDDAFRMESPTNFIKVYLGLWRHQSFGIKNGAFYVDDACTEYNSQTTVDKNWMVARAFGVLALVVGGLHIVIMLWLSFGSKKSFSRKSIYIKASPWVHLLCCLFQSLTLVIQSKFCNQSLKQGVENLLKLATVEWSDKCELESGSNMAIVSMVFWFLAFVLALLASCFKSRSLSAALSSNTDRDVHPNQSLVAAASKDDGRDEEAISSVVENPSLFVPGATDSVAASKPASIVTPRESSTPKQSSPKTSPSKQKNKSLVSSNNADNGSRVSSIVTRNVSVSSSKVASSKGSPGRRRAKYR